MVPEQLSLAVRENGAPGAVAAPSNVARPPVLSMLTVPVVVPPTATESIMSGIMAVVPEVNAAGATISAVTVTSTVISSASSDVIVRVSLTDAIDVVFNDSVIVQDAIDAKVAGQLSESVTVVPGSEMLVIDRSPVPSFVMVTSWVVTVAFWATVPKSIEVGDTVISGALPPGATSNPVPATVPNAPPSAENVPAERSNRIGIETLKVGEKAVTAKLPPSVPPVPVIAAASIDVTGTRLPPPGQSVSDPVLEKQNPPTLTAIETISAIPIDPAARAASLTTIGPPTGVPIGVRATNAPVASSTIPVYVVSVWAYALPADMVAIKSTVNKPLIVRT